MRIGNYNIDYIRRRFRSRSGKNRSQVYTQDRQTDRFPPLGPQLEYKPEILDSMDALPELNSSVLVNWEGLRHRTRSVLQKALTILIWMAIGGVLTSLLWIYFLFGNRN